MKLVNPLVAAAKKGNNKATDLYSFSILAWEVLTGQFVPKITTFDDLLSREHPEFPESVPKDLKEHLSFGFQKNSPYLQPFNYYIKRMQERGIFKQIFAKYEIHKQECPSPSLSIGFENCISAFFFVKIF